MKTMSGAGRIHYSSGFTLIEIMIAVVIVGILAAIAYPNYTAYVERGKRSDGRALLLETVSRMERYYSDCNKYPRFIGSSTNKCADKKIDLSTDSQNGYYTLRMLTYPHQRSALMSAIPSGWTDSDCGNLIILTNGERRCTACGNNATKIAKCWGK